VTERTTWTAAVLSALAVLTLSCGGDDGPTRPHLPDVAAVTVVSPIDTLIDLDRTVQLTATASDSQGREISGVDFVWRSSNTAVATVTTDGLVHPLAVGSVSITAEASGVSGRLRLRLVQADLDGIGTILDDPYTDVLVTHLSTATEPSMQTALDQCAAGISTGNLMNILEGLENAQAIVTSATDPDDRALTAVLGLLLDHAQRLLSL